MQEAKKNLRSQVKKKLSGLKLTEKKELDLEISNRLNQFLNSCIQQSEIQSTTIGVFYPLSDEVYWPNDLITKKQLAFPEVVGRKIVFRQCGLGDLLEINLFGQKMKTPGHDHQIVKPDIIIVPGIAFDRTGNRLGRGGGYYDSYLGKFDGQKIGICKDLQLVDELPIEDHDVKVDVIITEKNLIELTSPKEEK